MRANAIRRNQWDHTAVIWALTANINRKANTPAINPGEIHPLRDVSEYEPKQSKSQRTFEKMALLPDKKRAGVQKYLDRLQAEREAQEREGKFNGPRN